MTHDSPRVDFEPPRLLHVGMVVLDLEGAAANFERRWGTPVTGIQDVIFDDALYHGRPAGISLRRGFISPGGFEIELTQPLSGSLFRDFLDIRNGDGVHHLAYGVDDIDSHLERLMPTRRELVLDARLPGMSNRVVYLDGFAHGPTIELIERVAGSGPTTGVQQRECACLLN